MTLKQLRSLYDTCHDYGTVISGDWPTWTAVRKARQEGRIVARDDYNTGSIRIAGKDECHLEFDVGDEFYINQ